MTERSESLDQLATALCAAQAEFTAIPKDSTNPFFKSSYAGLPKVVEVASPILTKHGLSVAQFIGADEQGDTLKTWLLHKSGQFVAESMRLHLAKNDAQGQGSATTYARRYSYMAALGLVADEDDDGNSSRRAPAPPRQPDVKPREVADAKALETIIKGMETLGWKTGEVRLRLTAVGVQDVSDVRRALGSLSPRQADELWDVIEAATQEKAAS